MKGTKNERGEYIREEKKIKLVVLTEKEASLNNDYESDDEMNNSLDQYTLKEVFTDLLTMKERDRKYKEGSSKMLIVNRKYRCKKQKETKDDPSKTVTELLDNLDVFRNYKHYYPKYNLEKINKKYIRIMTKKVDLHKNIKIGKLVKTMESTIIDQLLGIRKREFTMKNMWFSILTLYTFIILWNQMTIVFLFYFFIPF